MINFTIVRQRATGSAEPSKFTAKLHWGNKNIFLRA
jgi:hypothetical protein